MNKTIKMTSMMASVSFVFFFTVIVPLQTYIANRDFFTFELSRLLMELGVLFVLGAIIVSGVTFLITWLLAKLDFPRIAIVPSAILAILIICGYLETSVLSYGLPTLDGDIDAISDFSRKILDLAVLMGASALLLPLFVVFRNLIRYILYVVLAMAIASVFDAYVKPPAKQVIDDSKFKHGKYDIARSITYSPVKNTFVFIIDSLPGTVASDVIRSNAELAEKFHGFVAYPDTVAMHEYTARGLPGLVTGKYFELKDDPAKYSETIFGRDSVVWKWLDDDDPVYFVPGLFEFGLSNRVFSHEEEKKCQQKCMFKVFEKCGLLPSLSLYEVCRFRLTPYHGKYVYMLGAIAKGRGIQNIQREDVLYPIMENASISNEEKHTLCIVHTRGVHLPILFGSDGKYFMTPANDIEGVRGAATAIMRRIGLLFDRMRKNNLYDNATIIITTDHGNKVLPHADNEMGQANAALIVKVPGGKDGFSVSDVPASLSKVSGLISSSKDGRLNQKVVNEILKTDHRLYRARKERSTQFYDWVYGAGMRLESVRAL